MDGELHIADLYQDDVEEKTEDGRYTRSDAPEPLFTKMTSNEGINWTCYEAFDEEESIDMYWHKLKVVRALNDAHNSDATTSNNGDDAMATAAFLKQVLDGLRTWSSHRHPLLLSVMRVWQAAPDSIDFISSADCGTHNVREYIGMHHVREPAMRNIARQVIKAMMTAAKHESNSRAECTPTLEDFHIDPASARLCLLPSCLWPRHQTDSGNCSQADILRAWAAMVLELYLGEAVPNDKASTSLLQELSTKPQIHPAAQQLLKTCLDEAEASSMPLGEVLDEPWLNTRVSYINGRDTPAGPANGIGANTSGGLSGRFSTMALSADGGSYSSERRVGPQAEQSPAGPMPAAEPLTQKSSMSAPIALGSVVGLNYAISASGHSNSDDSEIQFMMRLEQLDLNSSITSDDGGNLGDDDEKSIVLQFPFDVRRDTVDGVAMEMQEQFQLSETDTELAASTMREVIAHLIPGLERVMSVRGSYVMPRRSAGRSHVVPTTLTHTLPSIDDNVPMPPVENLPLPRIDNVPLPRVEQGRPL